ncbi:gamma-glutamylcyclotransferase family protein [Actimicrobium antarcticum]|uniref:Putative gamma-glutamylcyclotransferase n=1 Tax=Actimicrobium antarcticum TaxID=1051899 RepID=A0ABP7TYG8_9BURK
MPVHVFTYGSLMFPVVWQRVVRGEYIAEPARIADYQRYAVRGDTYPGITPRPGGSVDGLVYLNVDAADLAALDHFEGDGYRRIRVAASTTSGDTIMVQTYVFRNPAALSDQPWLPQAFQLQRFLETYCRDKLGS